MRNLLPICLVLQLCIGTAAISQESSSEMAAMQLLETLKKNDAEATREFIQTKLAPDFLSVATLEEHLSKFKRMGLSLKGAEVLNVRVRGDRAELFVISGDGLEFELAVETQPGPGSLIQGITLKPYMREEAANPEFSNLKEADVYLQTLASKDQFSGVVLVSEKDQPVFLRAYGMSNREKRLRNQTNTSFNVGSITKAFTGVAILQLKEKGMLRLQDPISKYLPEFPKEKSEKITILHLLRMESGYGDIFHTAAFRQRKNQLMNLDDYLDFIKDLPLEFEPGRGNRYSNAGYVILGGIIERVSGLSYFDYVEKHIFQPADMKDSGFPLNKLASEKFATGYTEGGPNIEFLAPRGTSAGGSYSSAEDLWKFYSALTSNKLLTANHTTLFLNHFDETKRALPPAFGIAGGAPGISAITMMNFQDQTGIIVLTNVGEGTAEVIGKALKSVMAPVRSKEG